MVSSKDFTWSQNTSFLPSADVWFVHHYVVWQLLCDREEDSTEGDESCTEDCCQQLHHHHGHLHQQMQEKDLLYLERAYSHPGHTLLLSPSPQAGASRVEFPD